MPCLITGGITKDCSMTVGGLSEIAIGNHSEIISYTKDVNGVVDSLELSPSAVFFKFEFEKNTASANQPLQVGTNKYVAPAITMSLKGYTQEIKEVMDLISVSTVVALCKLRSSGEWFIYGLDNGLEATANEGNTGAAEGDLNGFTITLTGSEVEFAPQIDTAIAEGVIEDTAEPIVLNLADLTYSTVGSEPIAITGVNFTGATDVQFVNQSDFTTTSQATIVVVSDTSITANTVAMAAGTYKIRVVNDYGYGDSPATVTVS